MMIELERLAQLDLQSDRVECAMAADNINALHKPLSHILRSKPKFSTKAIRLKSKLDSESHAASVAEEKALFREEFSNRWCEY